MDTRYLEMTEGSSSKFWEISANGSVVITRYGKLDTPGQTTEKDCGDPAAARKLYEKLVREKLGKGYVEHKAGESDSKSAKEPPKRESARGGAGTALIAPGRGFVFEMADFDVSDKYRFIVEGEGSGLTVRFEGIGNGSWTFTDAALEKARSFVVLAQGGAIGSDGESCPKQIKRDLPPFLLSRKVFAELAKGPSELKPEWSEDVVEIEIVAKGRAVLHANGKKVEHDAFKVEGDNIEFWMLDDPHWPVIVSRDEGDNYWHILAQGEDVELAGEHDVGELIVGETPFRTTKPRAPLDDAGLIAALRGEGSVKERCKAIEIAAMKSSPATRDALFVAHAAKQSDVSFAAKRALNQRVSEPGYAEALGGLLAVTEKAVQEGDTASDAYRSASRAVELVRSEHLAYAPLAECLRTIARSHKNHDLRDWARAVLVTNLEDDAMRRELVQQVDRGEPFPDVKTAKHAVDAVLQVHPADEARLHIEKLVSNQPHDQHWDIWNRVLFSLNKNDPAWARVLVAWWHEAEGERREAMHRQLKQMSLSGIAVDFSDASREVPKAVYDALDAENLIEAIRLYRAYKTSSSLRDAKQACEAIRDARKTRAL